MKEARAFTATRILALTVIGVLVIGLVYLRLGGEEAVSVPAGAKAGDLFLHDCTYPTEAGDLPADCGTLVVAENTSEPGSRLIALPIVRIRARSDDPGEPIFRLQGGPGISNMPFPPASRYAADRDFVLVGYRGVDGSVGLDCPEVVSALKHSTDLTGEASFQAFAAGFRACAARFADEGIDVTSYGLSQQVDDLEAAREALGYERINLVSESVGTRTAMIYAWRHPERINRSVMIAANPPGNFLWDPETTDEQIARYAEYCSNDAGCRGRTSDLAATMRSTEIPERWFFLPIDEGNVRSASHYGLMESNVEAAPLHAPMAIDSWLSAAEGDPSGFWFQSLLADFAFPTAFVWGQYASAASLDYGTANEYFGPERQPRNSNVGYAATAFGWAGGRLTEAWPASRDAGKYGQVRPSEVETLVVGGELDFAIPPQVAREQLLPSLENGQEVLLPGFGHSGDFLALPAGSQRQVDQHVRRERRGRRLALSLSAGRFHAGGHPPGPRQGHRGIDRRLRAFHGRLAAVDGAPRPQARSDRPEVRRDPAVRVPDRPRAGRLVPRPARGPHRHARGAARQRARGGGLDRRADRARDLLRLDAARSPGLDQEDRVRGGDGGRTGRSLARVQRGR
jgi:pimeloyl-ACP methyl ester carboxylesterase